MLYRLFLYATSASGNDAPVIPHINAAVSTGNKTEWTGWSAGRSLKAFPVDDVIQQIEENLNGKCRVHLRFSPPEHDQKPFLLIATSYAVAAEVLPRLHAIAAERDLVLYDAETDRSYYRDLIDEPFIQLRKRERKLIQAIHKANHPIWKIQELSRDSYYSPKTSYFAVTLWKDIRVPFQDRVRRFYESLQAALLPEETLKCEDKCFTVSSDWYAVVFCLEGYKKHPNQRGWVEDGKPCVELLHRMSCYEALRFLEKECSERGTYIVRARMLFCEMMDRYPNPADRFVHSVNITKAQRAEKKFDISYSDIGPYGADIIMYVVPNPYYDDKRTLSALKIGEETATFILPFFEELYPYFRERYYLADNYVPMELWVNLVRKIEVARQFVLYDTYNPVLQPYINQFNLHVLEDRVGPVYKMDPRIETDPVGFLYEHRYEVAHLYDIFLQWSNIQIEYHGEPSEDRMFNVSGP